MKSLIQTIKPLLTAPLLAACLQACGGGGGSDTTPSDNLTAELNTGAFIDSPVSGLSYSTGSQQGLTDDKGQFHYRKGEVVTFSIGNMTLGSASGAATVTPLDLGYGMNSDALDNVIRLLQTLDADGDPNNGITIASNARDHATRLPDTRPDVPAELFQSDSDLLNYLVQVTNAPGLIDVATARAHFKGTLARLNRDGYTTSTDSDNDGTADNLDAFPSDPTETADSDNDGVGDNSDPAPQDPGIPGDQSTQTQPDADPDGDGISNDTDNCPTVANPLQEDRDQDASGDLCDVDLDGDNVANDVDNCPDNFNPFQEDADKDQNGDICDLNTTAVNQFVQDFLIFDHDGPGIGKFRDCTPTLDCTPTRDCTFTKSHDTRDCSACLLKNPFGGCLIRGNDPICEAAKAAQNAIYEAEYAAKKADCERIKSSEKLACEARKTSLKLDCERLKSTQTLLAEVEEAFIHHSKNIALSQNPRPIPPHIRRILGPYFRAELLDKVLWTDRHGDIFSAQKAATEILNRNAITLDNIIVFKSEQHALNDLGLWAHELEHVKQYQLLGIDGFAQYYTHKQNTIESLASQQSAYVCSQLLPLYTCNAN